jgi:protein-disulfide isomerase
MKRFLPFIIIAFVGLVTVGVGAFVYRAKTQSATATAGGKATPAVEAEDSSLHVRGPRNAPVILEIYGDFQCPPCATASKAIDELQKQYEGKMRVVFHEFPLEMHPHAMEAAMAAEAAGIQGKFWEMHDMLYQYQPVWSRVSNAKYFFESYAESLKLDVARFRADCQAADLRARIMVEGKFGETRGVKNTPTIFINGTEAKAAFTKEKLQEAVNAALAAKKGS